MSVELVVEVLKHAPAELTPAERLLLVVIAESCRAGARTTWYRDGWDAAEVARRVGVEPSTLGKLFLGLSKKGCEVRVPHAVKDGKPVFAFRGKQTTFRLPLLRLESPDESPTFLAAGPEKGRTVVRESPDDSPTNRPESPDDSPTLLLKDLPSRNTSSLSQREPDADRPAGEDRERDDDAPLQEDQPQPRSAGHKALATQGITSTEADALLAIINVAGTKGPGWWRAVINNGDLPAVIAEARDQLAALAPGAFTDQPAPIPGAHPFVPDSSGISCEHCRTPEPNRLHRVPASFDLQPRTRDRPRLGAGPLRLVPDGDPEWDESLT